MNQPIIQISKKGDTINFNGLTSAKLLSQMKVDGNTLTISLDEFLDGGTKYVLNFSEKDAELNQLMIKMLE